MDAPFLGNGWPFPILPDASGKLSYVAGDDNVEQSLLVLSMTQFNDTRDAADLRVRVRLVTCLLPGACSSSTGSKRALATP